MPINYIALHCCWQYELAGTVEQHKVTKFLFKLIFLLTCLVIALQALMLEQRNLAQILDMEHDVMA